jgi:dienelactone hydrolase
MIRFLLFLSVASLANARNFEIEVPGLPYPIKVSLPENHKAGEKHHTIFYYHGTSGRPTTSLMRNHTGSKDWIVVGMTYQQKGTFTLNADTWQAERKAYHAVRKIMVENHGTDPDHLYLAGFSKGGWHTNLMLQSEPTVCGGIIMGAGHLHFAPTTLKKYNSKKPVHVGIGRSDGNYPFALNALLYHRKMGGNPTLEVWPTLGHDFPESGSPSLKQWLNMRVQSPEKLSAIATRDLDKLIVSAETLKPLEQWDLLREIKQMPYFQLTSESWQKKHGKKMRAIESNPQVAAEAKLFSQHRRLLHQEITNKTLSSLKKVNQSYLNLSSQYPKTRQGKLMEEDFVRTEKLLKHFEEQEKLRPKKPKPIEPETEAPDSRRRIPGSPLIR